MKKKITCIICPRGCEIEVEGIEEKISTVSGNGCKRGEAYAKEEYLHPSRLLMTSILVENSDRKRLPVRSTKRIPKEKVMECMEIIKGMRIKAPVTFHQIIIHNIMGTGADMIAAMPLEEE